MKTLQNIFILFIGIMLLSFFAKMLLFNPILLWLIIIIVLFLLTRKN